MTLISEILSKAASRISISKRLGAALILAALCGCGTPEPIAARNRALAQRIAREYDRAYDRCLYRVTGPFASASIEVMRECDRQAQAIADAM